MCGNMEEDIRGYYLEFVQFRKDDNHLLIQEIQRNMIRGELFHTFLDRGLYEKFNVDIKYATR